MTDGMTGLVTIVGAIAMMPTIIAVGIWALRRPERTLALYAAVVPFGSSISLPLGLPPAFSTLSTQLGIVVATVFIIEWARTDFRPPPRSNATIFWFLFLAWAAASVAWSLNRGTTTDNLILLVSLVGLYATVGLIPLDHHAVATVRNGVVLGAALTGAYAVVLAATSRLPQTGAGVARFEITGGGGGEGGDPNITAAALLLGFALGLHATVSSNDARHVRALHAGGTVLAATGIVLTASRGGLLAMIVAAIIILVQPGRRRAVSMVALAIALLPAAFLISDTLTERADNTGTSGRSEIWAIGIGACPEHCAIGSGFGTFPDVHQEGFLNTPSASADRFRFQAHSIWIGALVELGVVGLGLMVAALLALARKLTSVSVRGAGALAALAGVLLANTFLSNLLFKYFWLTLTYGSLVAMAELRPTPADLATSGLRAAGDR